MRWCRNKTHGAKPGSFVLWAGMEEKEKPHLRFRPVAGQAGYEQVAALAEAIWKEHYTPIIGPAQVGYMLEHFQSPGAIARQVGGGMEYFLLLNGEVPVGYLAFEARGQDLFLSKIYLLRALRGKGLGREAMGFVVGKAREKGCRSISLTVNKNNDRSIAAYERMGFERKEALVVDIGGGFVMDDYRMVKTL